ncbi:MAG: hypothetical protein IJJ34_00955 [Clostridia bacterium]|nr:hypothetical protein [Clostridia bacterium]
MAGLLEYKCPCCNGAITFDSALQKMKCPYCETEFDVETLQAYDEVLSNMQAPDEMEWQQNLESWGYGEAENLRVYSCASCGGEIVGDVNTAATSCPFCGNPVIMMQQFAGDLKPALVLPFKLGKEDAKNILRGFLKDKTLVPKAFKEESHLDEITGMYVPFWLFDARANARGQFRTTRVSSWLVGRQQHTRTDHYSSIRDGFMDFHALPVDASKKIANDLMESLEPFDAREAVKFQTAYLAGYVAERYDDEENDCMQRVNERIRTSAQQAIQSTVVGFASVQQDSLNVQLEGAKATYALLPVWFLNTTWNGQHYAFAINGQNGRIAGDDLPEDTSITKRLVRRKWLLTSGITAAVIPAVFLFFRLIFG